MKSKFNLEMIKEFGNNEKDSGSSSVQVAILTQRINHLTEHLKENKKDKHSRFGLIKMVSKRRKLLKYISEKENDLYKKIIKQLNLRK